MVSGTRPFVSKPMRIIIINWQLRGYSYTIYRGLRSEFSGCLLIDSYRACARFVGGAAFNRNVWQKPEEIVLCCTQNAV